MGFYINTEGITKEILMRTLLLDEEEIVEITEPLKQVKYFDEDEKVWKIGNIINQ